MRGIIQKLVLLLICISSYETFAQSNKDFRYYDTLSSKYYSNQAWDSLIYVYNDAVSNQYDWYYLQMRIGIAFYEKKNFPEATFYFKKAYKHNPDDVTTQEYLYYSLLFSGREDDARAFLHQIDHDLIQKINPIKNPTISGVYIEGGIAFSNNIPKIDLDNSKHTEMPEYSESDLNKNMTYFHFGLTHKIGKRITVYQAYSIVGIDKQKTIRITPPKDSLKPPIDIINNYTISQKQYYIQLGWTQFNKFTIKPAFQLMYNNFSTIFLDSVSQNIKHANLTIYEYLASIMAEKEIGRFTLGLNASWSNLDKGTQFQGGINLSHLFQNWHTLLSTTRINLLFDKNTNPLITASRLRAFISQKFSLPLSKHIYGGVTGTFGSLCHANEMNGLYVYNSTDAINYKLGLDATYFLNQHFYLSLHYNYINKSNSYLKEINNNTTINHFNYNNHFLIGAIQWKI